MTKSIQQIKTELEALESTVAEAAEALQDLYKDYLDLLSSSVDRQLILASYQICTQFYPQSFLQLSLSQKQDLQQKIRNFGKEIQPLLLSSSEQKELDLKQQELNIVAEMLKNLPTSSSKNKEKEEDDRDDEEEMDLESIKNKLKNIEILEVQDREEKAAEANIKEEVDFNNPEHLILWHKQVEKQIKKYLDITSKKINKCLQDANVIPSRLSTKIIEVAMQGDNRNSSGGDRKLKNLPNIVNLTIEAEKEKKPKITSVAKISLLRLRLSEIEFSDPLLNAKRTQIRKVVGKIGQLRRSHRQKKQEYAVAEAEAAWRSSWYED